MDKKRIRHCSLCGWNKRAEQNDRGARHCWLCGYNIPMKRVLQVNEHGYTDISIVPVSAEPLVELAASG